MEVFKKYKESILYIVFGILTVVINILSYLFMTRFFALNIIYSNLIAWIIAVVFAYVTNKFFVFKSEIVEIRFLIKEFISFVSCRIGSLFVEIIIIYIGVDYFHIGDFEVKIFTNLVVIVLNYLLSKLIIFKK